jgi:hypothetical protein
VLFLAVTVTNPHGKAETANAYPVNRHLAVIAFVLGVFEAWHIEKENPTAE